MGAAAVIVGVIAVLFAGVTTLVLAKETPSSPTMRKPFGFLYLGFAVLGLGRGVYVVARDPHEALSVAAMSLFFGLLAYVKFKGPSSK